MAIGYNSVVGTSTVSSNNFGSKAVEYFKAMGGGDEQLGRQKVDQAHVIGGLNGQLTDTGIGKRTMEENARKAAEEVKAGNSYSERLNRRQHSSLHTYDSFESSQDSQPEHQIMNRQQMAALVNGSNGLA